MAANIIAETHNVINSVRAHKQATGFHHPQHQLPLIMTHILSPLGIEQIINFVA
uniref:Uncharacterized protein n=1 Tax=Arion vulgaris TaxID=1028688 RepID=A0A0B6YUQ0_9EUPU